MLKIKGKLSYIYNHLPGKLFLVIAIIIFSSAGSVISKLTEIGEQNLINGHNPISFCNVLFVGNIVALILMIFLYYQDFINYNWQQISKKDFLYLNLISILDAALVPSLFFLALANTMVNNVVLIGRIEPPLTLFLAILFIRERVNHWVIIGSIVSFIGVVLTIFLQQISGSTRMINMGLFELNQGDLYALIGAISLSIVITISKVSLQEIPVGIFSIYKTFVGTITFFLVTIFLLGIEHFRDIFAPILWQWMLFYGVVIVVGGQLFWLSGLQKTTASDVSFASSFSPIIGIIAAYFIVGEIPTIAQYIGVGVIFFGICITQIGSYRERKIKEFRKIISVSDTEEISFKGV